MSDENDNEASFSNHGLKMQRLKPLFEAEAVENTKKGAIVALVLALVMVMSK